MDVNEDNLPPSLVEAATLYAQEHENKEEPEYITDLLELLHYTQEQCDIIEKVSRGQGYSTN